MSVRAQPDLAAALRTHAARAPDSTAFVYLERGEREAARISYAELDLRARAVAAELQARNCLGERVLLAMPTGLEFAAAFFGCLYAGAVAVPAPEPENRRGAERSISICGDCGPKLALTQGTGAPELAELAAMAGGERPRRACIAGHRRRSRATLA